MESSSNEPGGYKSSKQQFSPMEDSNDSLSSLHLADKIPVYVEVCQKRTSTAPEEDIRKAVERLLATQGLSRMDDFVPVTMADSPYLSNHVESITIVGGEAGDEETNDKPILLFWQLELHILVFQLNEDGVSEELEEDEDLALFQDWLLPAREFHGLWESLVYDGGLKLRLLQYATSALHFSDKGVDPNLISWNRVVLLFGPPGTGKTSLCKAVAQKLAIRFSHRHKHAQLVEINAHSLFSKWFSESGKLVSKLFRRIGELLKDRDSLVFVLIDEVESITAARQAALSGSEPSDSIRVVNALLTQIDALKQAPNVLILTTSNITQAIDAAFVDRADIKAFVGNPSLKARYGILRSCIAELRRVGIISNTPIIGPVGGLGSGHSAPLPLVYEHLPKQSATRTRLLAHEYSAETYALGTRLLSVAQKCEGLSARALRKLPFLAHAARGSRTRLSCREYIAALSAAVEAEQGDRADMQNHEARAAS